MAKVHKSQTSPGPLFLALSSIASRRPRLQRVTRFLQLAMNNFSQWCKTRGGGNAIYVPYGDVPPIRVYFLAFESETGCLFSILTLKQGAKFVRSIWARCLFTVLFGTLTLVLTYLFFVQEIKPRFDVFSIFIVIIWHTVQEFVRVSFVSFVGILWKQLFSVFWYIVRLTTGFSLKQFAPEFAPPQKTIGLKTIEKLA